MIVIRLFASLRFGISLLIIVAIASAAASLAGWEGFFGSLYFLIPCGLFALSLLTCTVFSLAENPIRPLTGYAHDVIHLALLTLLLGGLLTLLAAQEEEVVLDIGESITVRNEWKVKLVESSRTATNWESILEVSRNGEEGRRERLAVNEPVRVGPVRLLQQSWEDPRVLILEDDAGQRYTMEPGEGFAAGETVIVLEEAEETSLGLRFARFDQSKRTGLIDVEEGMTIAELTVVGSQRKVRSGIQVVHDPGAPVALAGAVVLLLGFALYVAKKRREET